MFSADLLLSCSIFHKVCAATGKAQVTAFVLSLGTASIFELDDWSCLCCLAGVSIESKQIGDFLDERAFIE